MNDDRIHFLDSLSFVRVPDNLYKGVEVLQVAANGKTNPSLLKISNDKFTVLLQTEARAGLFHRSVTSYKPIDIGEIDRVQRGQSTQQFERAKKYAEPQKVVLARNTSTGSAASTLTIHQLDPKRSFSIVFRGAKTLDLMALSNQSRDEICNALDAILNAYQLAKTRVANDVRLLRYVWLDVDKDKTGFVNESQLAKILDQINFTCKSRELAVNFEKFGKILSLDRAQRRKGLTFEQSASFLHYLRRNSWVVKPINVVWNELFGEVMNNGKKRETVSDKTFLERFLRGKQGQVNSSIVDVRKLFRRLHDMELAHATGERPEEFRIHRDHFEAFLLAAENDAFDPEKEQHNPDDMNQPLSEYWINSSHNTYLIGDQYTSHSSVEMYSNALYRGCRCLELDIWDGGKSANGTPVPVVWHGHTMTTKIHFVDIIKTIKVFLNFHPDSFPIILSFENHCTIPYQEVMAEQLVRILGDSLYVPTETSLFGKLPSPAQLRGMVVIKGRRPDGTEADTYDSDDDSDEDGPTSSMGDFTAFELQNQKIAHNVKNGSQGTCPQLAKLTLLHGHKWKSWEDSVRSPTHHMHSFSENKVRSKCRNRQTFQWIVYNQTHMSRTYPAGSRVDSSNYNPLLAWSTGCQMVSLNFQTQDAFLRLNDGRFRENGNCGYVLKPNSLMVNDFSKETTSPVRVSIRVLTGSCLPKKNGDRTGDCISPYVKVSVFDIKDDIKENAVTYPTSVAFSNGFSPIWGQEKFTFMVEDWAVAMVQLTVIDKTKEDFIASASIPISCLRRGIRSVKLYDVTNTRSGAFDFATLLIDIKIGQGFAEI